VMGDRLRAGMPSQYVTSHLGQLSFVLEGSLSCRPPAFAGGGVKYTVGKAGRNVTSVFGDPIWHVS